MTSPDAASSECAQTLLSRILKRHLDDAGFVQDTNKKDNKKNEQYQQQNQEQHQEEQEESVLSSIRIISTCDPFGVRCGSGGGTIAALNEYTTTTTKTNNEAILILHAGGDSSRCPTQMILGKAWTTLPCLLYENPTIWLIQQIQQLFQYQSFPCGSIVVTATDCLLSFFFFCKNNQNHDHHYDNNNWNVSPLDVSFSDDTLLSLSSSVIGLAVPANIETAQNHGVYILPPNAVTKNTTTTNNNNMTTVQLYDPLDVWQKPLLEKLIHTRDPAPASFILPNNNDRKDHDHKNNTMDNKNRQQQQPKQQQRMAWIDTGVIIFLPKAAKKLYQLSHGSWSMCTRKGIQAAYDKEIQQRKQRKITTSNNNSGSSSSNNNNEQQQDKKEEKVNDDDDDPSIEEFAKRYALKIDLYTDILHNLSWSSSSSSSSREMITTTTTTSSTTSTTTSTSTTTNINNNNTMLSFREIWKDFHLRILCDLNGQFLHLGTTKELVNFVTLGAYHHSTKVIKKNNNNNNNNNIPLDSNNNNNSATATKDDEQEEKDDDNNVIASLSKQLGLVPRYKCWGDSDCDDGTNDDVEPNKENEKQRLQHRNVALWSTFPTTTTNAGNEKRRRRTTVTIGHSTLVEYCDLKDYESITIGNGSMISGWRRRSSNPNIMIPSPKQVVVKGHDNIDHDDHDHELPRHHGHHLCIPDNVSVQMLQLKNNNNNKDMMQLRQQQGQQQQQRKGQEDELLFNCFVLMVLGIHDGIKTSRQQQHATIFGLSVDQFFQQTGLCPTDIGWTLDNDDETRTVTTIITNNNNNNNQKNDCLWTAKLHPIVPQGQSFESLFSWLKGLHDVTTTTTTASTSGRGSNKKNKNTPTSLQHNNTMKDPSLIRWKACTRVSLKQLHSLVDAKEEWKFREYMEHQVNELYLSSSIPTTTTKATTTKNATTTTTNTPRSSMVATEVVQQEGGYNDNNKKKTKKTNTTTAMQWIQMVQDHYDKNSTTMKKNEEYNKNNNNRESLFLGTNRFGLYYQRGGGGLWYMWTFVYDGKYIACIQS